MHPSQATTGAIFQQRLRERRKNTKSEGLLLLRPRPPHRTAPHRTAPRCFSVLAVPSPGRGCSGTATAAGRDPRGQRSAGAAPRGWQGLGRAPRGWACEGNKICFLGPFPALIREVSCEVLGDGEPCWSGQNGWCWTLRCGVNIPQKLSVRSSAPHHVLCLCLK